MRPNAHPDLPQRILALIRQEGLRPGDMLPTETVLAERFQVSRSPIRNALEILVANGVTRREAHRGHVLTGVADPLAQTVVLLSDCGPNHQDGSGLLAGVPIAARRAGYDAWCRFSVRDLAGQMLPTGSRPAGILVDEWLSSQEHHLPALQTLAAQAPLVALGDAPHLAAFDRIVTDQEDGAFRLTRWLLDRGCRRIVSVNFTRTTPWWLVRRRRGHLRAMHDAGVHATEPLERDHAPHLESGGAASTDELTTWAAGLLAPLVLGREPIDAILLVTDAHAPVIGAALAMLAPDWRQRIALAGFDATWTGLAAADPSIQAFAPVVTVDTGRSAIPATFIDVIRDRSGVAGGPPRQHLLTSSLVLLES